MPLGIEKVYETAAKLLETDIVTLQKQIFTNFATLWNTGKTELAY